MTATDANGNTTSYTYNARNEKVSMTDAMERTTSYGYDADGNLITVTTPLDQYHDLFVYARKPGRHCHGSARRTTTYEYDADDELTSVTDPNGYETTYAYSDLGQLAGVSEEVEGNVLLGIPPYEQAVATYTYDPDGNLTHGERRQRQYHDLHVQRL